MSFLVYVPIGLATGGQVNVVHQQVLCALAEVLVEDGLLPPEVLDYVGGTLGTKGMREVTAEMDKGIMVADSFRSEQECCAELALVWKHAKEGKKETTMK
ncbi:hypothetical protein TNCV_2259851 [Trichonephila clavipes]|nr:hypothetical protein TNCV_2259851 [Trichonephila clavipes]